MAGQRLEGMVLESADSPKKLHAKGVAGGKKLQKAKVYASERELD